MHKTLAVVGILATGLLLFCARQGEGQAPAGTEEKAIRQTVAAYADSFNKGDLTTLATFWAPDAEYINEAGKVTRGRDAVMAMFKQFLADQKGVRLALTVTNVRVLTPDVVLQDGASALTAADGSVDEGRYSAVWTRSGGKWQLRNARDLPYEAGEGPGAGGTLKELQWMLGSWEGDKKAITVNVRWGLNRAFLVKEYKVTEADGELQVMQMIGFDPLTGQIKSWTFDSRGGYGEGLWQREGNVWTIETAGVLPNGQTGSATNILRFVDDKTIIFQTRERQVAGQPLPDGEVKLTRTAAAK